MTATYLYTDAQGETLEIPRVLAPLELQVTKVTADSNVVEVVSTEGVWPGMAYHGPQMSQVEGTYLFVIAVLSATKLELAGMKWDAAAGFFLAGTAIAFPAETDETAGNLATVLGFSERPAIFWQPGGLWFNEVYSKGMMKMLLVDGIASTVEIITNEMPYAPWNEYTDNGAGALLTGVIGVAKSDSMAAVPLQRHKGQPTSFWVLISQDGHQTVVPAGSKCKCSVKSFDAEEVEE